MAERMMGVPVPLIERAKEALLELPPSSRNADIYSDLHDLLQPISTAEAMVAEPVSIADLAPGTTFTAVFHGEQDRFFRCRDSLARAGRYLVAMDAIDPSTIRDVTPPPATPEEGDR